MVRGTPGVPVARADPARAASPRSDVYALGVVVYEMLTGRAPVPRGLAGRAARPAPAPSDPLGPRNAPRAAAGGRRVIARATAKDPRPGSPMRWSSRAAFRGAFEGAARGRHARGRSRNPYKGLRAFLEADARDFFGREALVAPARRAARARPEPRGSSSSSDRRDRASPPSSEPDSCRRCGAARSPAPSAGTWSICFRARIRCASWSRRCWASRSNLRRRCSTTSSATSADCSRAVDRILPDPDAELDRRSISSRRSSPSSRTRPSGCTFLESLRAAVAEPGSRVRVVATLRADFFDQPLSVRGFGDLLAARIEAITPMSPEDLERAIVGPGRARRGSPSSQGWSPRWSPTWSNVRARCRCCSSR